MPRRASFLHLIGFAPATTSPTSIAAAILLCLALPGQAQEWTRFRGPNGTGVSDATTVPATWSEKDYNWKAELPGIGHSSPVIWGDRIFLTSAFDDTATRLVLCLSAADGSIIWQREYKSTPHGKHQLNSFASSTPCVDEERLYASFVRRVAADKRRRTNDGGAARIRRAASRAVSGVQSSPRRHKAGTVAGGTNGLNPSSASPRCRDRRMAMRQPPRRRSREGTATDAGQRGPAKPARLRPPLRVRLLTLRWMRQRPMEKVAA
jgi:hypothetical protein